MIISKGFDIYRKRSDIVSKRPITRYLSSEYNFLYNKNIKEGMEENKMSKQIVP